MAKSTHGKLEEFLWIYKEGIERHVPKVVMKEMKKKEWFNIRCELVRRKREEAWKRWRGKGGNNLWKKYKTVRNEFVRIRREEDGNYKKNII